MGGGHKSPSAIRDHHPHIGAGRTGPVLEVGGRRCHWRCRPVPLLLGPGNLFGRQQPTHFRLASASVASVCDLDRLPDDQGDRGQLNGMIDLRVHGRRDPDRGGPRNFLETAADGVFETMCAVQVGCKEGRDPGQDPDDQQSDEEFLLQAASPWLFHRPLGKVKVQAKVEWENISRGSILIFEVARTSNVELLQTEHQP